MVEMRKPRSGLLVIVMLVVESVAAQSPPCAGKYRTTMVGGSGTGMAMAANRNLLVTTDFDSLTVWDHLASQGPTRIGQWISAPVYRSWGVDDRMVIDDFGFAYVGDFWDLYRVEIFDLRDPVHPIPIRWMPPLWNDFIVSGHLLIGSDNALDIYDVSDPFHPVPVCDGCFSFRSGSPSNSYSAVAMAGDHLLAVNSNGLWVLDISDPADPVEVYSTVQSRPHDRGVRVWAGDDRAVVVSENGGLQVIDLTDPSQPVIHDQDSWINHALWGEFHGQKVFIGDYYGLHGLDLSDPAELVDIEPFGDFAWSAALFGDTLFLGDGAGIRAFDVSGPPAPIGVDVPWLRTSHIRIDGDLGIVTGSTHVRSLDLSGPAGPVEKDRVTLSSYTQAAAVEGVTIAVPVLGLGGGVRVLTVDSDGQLTDRGEIALGDCVPRGVDIHGGILAIGLDCDDGSGAVDLRDLGDPSAPELLSRHVVDFPVQAVILNRDRVFATNGGSVLVIDVSDPTSPVLSGELLISEDVGNLHNLAISGDCLFVGSSYYFMNSYESLLAAVDVSSPDEPSIRSVSENGSHWLASSDDGVAGGDYWELFLAHCPADGEDLQPEVFSLPRSGMSGGAIRNGTLYLAARHSIDELDLQCEPPDVDFTWYQMGTKVRFDDRTTFFDRAVGGYYHEREWKWTFSNGRRSENRRSPLIDFELPGVYTATLEVTTEMGTSVVTKTIEVPRQTGLSPSNRNSGGRVKP